MCKQMTQVALKTHPPRNQLDGYEVKNDYFPSMNMCTKKQKITKNLKSCEKHILKEFILIQRKCQFKCPFYDLK